MVSKFWGSPLISVGVNSGVAVGGNKSRVAVGESMGGMWVGRFGRGVRWGERQGGKGGAGRGRGPQHVWLRFGLVRGRALNGLPGPANSPARVDT